MSNYYISPYDAARDFRFGYYRFDQFPSASFGDLFANELYSADRHLNFDENDDEYVLTIELPGFKQSNLDVQLVDNVLSIKAKRGDVLSYDRALTIPRGVDADKISALLEDGILTVRLAKVPEVKPRKIPVK